MQTTIIALLTLLTFSNSATAGCETRFDKNAYIDLRWKAPDRFVDGSSLDVAKDLTGYEIYLLSPGAEPEKIADTSGKVLGCRLYLEPGVHTLGMKSKGRDDDSEISNAITEIAIEKDEAATATAIEKDG